MNEYVDTSFDSIDEETKPTELNYIQKAFLTCDIELEDGVLYDGELLEVKDGETGPDTPIVSYVYGVNGIEVKDTYFLSQNAIKLNISRLKETLQKFNYSLGIEDLVDGAKSIAKSTKCLVGTKVTLKQTSRVTKDRTFKNIEVVSVIGK
ncbi:MAG: hypothetical protein HFI86_01920 [Bacilli bacterium]|nr:hypothetical protein [Bacilli bacterium]